MNSSMAAIMFCGSGDDGRLSQVSGTRTWWVKIRKTTAKSVILFDAYLCPIFTLFKFQVIDLRNSSADRSVDYGHFIGVGCTRVELREIEEENMRP